MFHHFSKENKEKRNTKKACAFFDIDHANTFFVAVSTFDKNNINMICDHENEYRPLHLAVNKKDEVAIGAIIHILSTKIKDKTLTKRVLNSKDKEGNTPLTLAVQNAIDSKTTTDYKNSYNCIVILIFNAVEGLSELVEVNSQSNTLDTCLTLAATYNLTDIVELLLKRKDIDVNVKDKDGFTALTAAVATRSNHAESEAKKKFADDNKKCVELLLNHQGIHVNIADKKGFSSIVYAAYYGKIEIFKLLINHKDINIDIKRNQNQISDRDNILHNCRNNIRSKVEELLDKIPLRNSSTELVDKIPMPERRNSTSGMRTSDKTKLQSLRRHSIGGSKNKKTKRRSNKKRKSEKKKIFN